MISSYQQVELDDAEAGMILAASVLDHQGSVLLQSGTALDEGSLRALRRRGIDSVAIVDDQVSAAESEARRVRVTAHLERLFRRPGQSAADAALLLGVRSFRLGSAQ
jgi:hypothetical protein